MNIKCLYGLLLLTVCLLPKAHGQSDKAHQPKSQPNGTQVPDDYLSRLLYAVASGDTLWQKVAGIADFKDILKEVTTKEKLPLAQEFSKLNGTIKRVKEAANLKKLYNSSLVNMSYYAANTMDTSGQRALGAVRQSRGDFMNLNGALNFNILGVPLAIQSSLVLEGGQLKTDFSYTNLRFDLNKYQNDLRDKLSAQTLKQQLHLDDKMDKITEGVHLNAIDEQLLTRDMGFTLYKGLMNHPKIQKMRSDVFHRLDSIRTKKVNQFIHQLDSLGVGVVNSGFQKMDSLKNARLKDSTFWLNKWRSLGEKELKLLGLDKLKLPNKTNDSTQFNALNSFSPATASGFQLPFLKTDSVQSNFLQDLNPLKGSDFKLPFLKGDSSKPNLLQRLNPLKNKELAQNKEFNSLRQDAKNIEQQVNSFSFEQMSQRWLNLDSLKNILLSDPRQWRDKLPDANNLEVDSLFHLQNTIGQITNRFESLWESRKTYIHQFEQLKDKFSTVESSLKKLEDTDSLTTALLKTKGLQLKDKLLLKVKGLETGQIGADETDFLLKNQLLNGVKFEHGSKANNWGILVGRSRLQALNAPVFYNPFQRLTAGREFMMVKMGRLLRDSSRMSLRVMNVHKTRDSLFQGNLTPNYNTVVGLNYEKNIGKQWQVQTELAVSNTRQAMAVVEEDGTLPTTRKRNWAASSTLYWAKYKALSIGLGYYYVGDGFYTFGNDFLINNRNGLKTDFKSSLFKDHLQMKLEVKRGVLNTPQNVGLSAAALTQISGEATWQLGKNQVLQFQYTPNTLTERQVGANGQGFDYHSNIFLLMGNFTYQLAKTKQSTLIMFSNLNQQIDFFDTLKVTKTNYLSLRHEAFLSEKSSVILKVNGGLAQTGAVQTGQIQGDAKFLASKKCQLTMGLQAVKKRIEPSWRGGVVTQVNVKIGKQLIAKSGFIYRFKNTGGGILHNEWIANGAMTLQF